MELKDPIKAFGDLFCLDTEVWQLLDTLQYFRVHKSIGYLWYLSQFELEGAPKMSTIYNKLAALDLIQSAVVENNSIFGRTELSCRRREL